MRVDDAGARAPDGVGDVPGRGAARQEVPGHGAARAAEGVALQQLDLLAEVLAHEPGEVGHRALLAALGAVAVVQEEDHGAWDAREVRVDAQGARGGRAGVRQT